MEKKKHKISEKKIKNVKDLAGLLDSYDTIMIASTANLASAQLQKARKILRGKASLRYAKKSTALRAFDSAKKEGVKNLKEHITESPALIFSNEDPFEIATILTENRFPTRAKAGQLAPKDINIEAGPTDLLPGPVISEFGAVGIKAGIVGGKIAIKEPKLLIKNGELITPAIASILLKLDILPFESGLDAEIAYSSSENKIFTGIKIDKAGTLASLQEYFAAAYQFAIEIGYPTSENVSQIIINVSREANALQKKLDEAKPAEEEKKEESAKEAEQPTVEEKKEEKPVEAQPASETQESSSKMQNTTEEK